MQMNHFIQQATHLTESNVKDYAVWIQRVPDSHLESLCTALNKLIPGTDHKSFIIPVFYGISFVTKSSVIARMSELNAAALVLAPILVTPLSTSGSITPALQNIGS